MQAYSLFLVEYWHFLKSNIFFSPPRRAGSSLLYGGKLSPKGLRSSTATVLESAGETLIARCRGQGKMTLSNGIDYAAEAELFDYASEAELYSRSSAGKSRRPPLGYKRFARASDALRFAIEELSPQLLVTTVLEVAERRYQSREIRLLYESDDYPLARRV